MGKRVKRTTNGTWETLADEEVLQAAGIKTSDTYILLRQGMVVQLVSLYPILKLFAQE